MYDGKGDLTPEFKTQALELVQKVGAICKEYHPALVLFVLEAAMAEQISIFSPPLSDLFEQTMKTFKGKAAVLITVAELLKGKSEAIRNGASIESILSELGVATAPPEPEPKA